MPRPDEPAERDGLGPGDSVSRQRWVPAMIAAALVLLVIVGIVIYRSTTVPNVNGALASYDLAEGGVLPITVEIVRDAGLAVECDVVAVDDRQIIVGQLLLEVPAGPDTHLRVEAGIPLEGDGIAAKMRGCRPA